MRERPPAETRQADKLLGMLHDLQRAVRDGGQVSELHLEALRGQALKLLYEVGGFDDLIEEWRGL